MTNEPLKQLFIDTVVQTREGIARAVEIAMREMPELCEQIIRFAIAKHSVIAVGALAGAFAIIYFGKKFAKLERDEFYTGLGIVAAIIPFCVAGGAIVTILKASIAPKLFLIEYAASLIK